MADILIAWDPATLENDWLLGPPLTASTWTDERGMTIVDEAGRPVGAVATGGDGLVAGGDLFNAVLISLFSDAVAGRDDTTPDGSSDPRGWWAGPLGSRLWLRARSKTTAQTLALVKADIADALAWLVEDGVAAAIDVETEYTQRGLLGARVIVRQRDGTRVAVRFAKLWETA